MAHFFVVVGGSKIHERLAHFFIDIYKQCYLAENDIKNYGSYSIPFKVTVKKQEQYNKYSVIDSRYPREGAYYSEDMKKLFPSSVIKDINQIHKDGTYEKLQLDIENQVQLYFHKEYYPFIY